MTTPRQRDRGLDRVSRITRWSIVGATVATGLFGFLLACPPTTAKATATGTTDDQSGAAIGSGSTPTTQAGSSGSSSGSTNRSSRTTPQLQAPSQSPQRSSRPSRATSGGS